LAVPLVGKIGHTTPRKDKVRGAVKLDPKLQSQGEKCVEKIAKQQKKRLQSNKRKDCKATTLKDERQ
jgi:hypothetical protein